MDALPHVHKQNIMMVAVVGAELHYFMVAGDGKAR